jgi:tetratricopeptide (TPR) repeat protein
MLSAANETDAINAAAERQIVEQPFQVEPQPMPLSSYPPPDAAASYPPPEAPISYQPSETPVFPEAVPAFYPPPSAASPETTPSFEATPAFYPPPTASFEGASSFESTSVFETSQLQQPQLQPQQSQPQQLHMQQAPPQQPQQQKKSKKTLFIALGAALLIVVLAVGAVVGFNIYRSNTYDDAMAALNAKDYQQALETFEGLGDYRDAANLALRARQGIDYEAALALLDAEDYEAALGAFLELGDFADTRALATLCQQNIDYRAALDAFEAGDFEEALEGFADLAAVGFSDSSEQRDAVAYAIADQKFNAGDRYAAYQDFEALGSYKDSSDRMQQCTTEFPATGELYHNDGYRSSSSAIVIDATSSSYTSYYKIYSGGDLVSTIFLNVGGSCTIEVPPGDYTLKEASGTTWFGEDVMFGDEGYYELLLFDGNNDYFTLEYNVKVTITLSVLNGDVGSSPTDRMVF